jgi:hypothetical protein
MQESSALNDDRSRPLRQPALELVALFRRPLAGHQQRSRSLQQVGADDDRAADPLLQSPGQGRLARGCKP